ncbi:metal-dependent hydrolase [Nitzschia inconspicua]|uniref:Metal-dependent hydrolase n=1 Tax=Nitzschia inconspicua TaxID=303405 RepID=A0A9K3KD71_9STRA|nr:metal-dependent hydrolase [Nitzschia inconspicua]
MSTTTDKCTDCDDKTIISTPSAVIMKLPSSAAASSTSLPQLSPPPSSPPSSLLLPFDAHNHVQLGPTPVIVNELRQSLCGMAVMSTHPRDFHPVLDLAAEASSTFSSSLEDNFRVVPCLGIHPWFLHELLDDQWEMVETTTTTTSTATSNQNNSNNNNDHGDDDDDVDLTTTKRPRWVVAMETLLLQHPNAVVGEIGLDKFHFDPVTKDLTSSMERQIDAFRYQLQLATQHHRPVSMHCVRAMGPVMDTIQEVYQTNNHKLPPKLYFHAFGGKAATATQIIKTLEKLFQKNNNNNNSKNKNNNSANNNIYFGFAPVINNLESAKTYEVIRAVGLDRLVLETDHEDVQYVPSSMAMGVSNIAKTLGVTPQQLICTTNANVRDLYSNSNL